MEHKLFMNRNCKIVDKSGSILFTVVVIHMDAFQPKSNYTVLSFLKYFHKNEKSELFGVNRDLERKEIQIKLEIYF